MNSLESLMFLMLRKNFEKVDSELDKVADFRLRIDVKVSSPILPDFLMSKYTDTINVIKVGKSLRMDFSLMPAEGGGILKQSSSLYYNPLNVNAADMKLHNNLVLVNHEKGTFYSPFSRITLQEKQHLLREIFYKVNQNKVDASANQISTQDLSVSKSMNKGLHQVELKFSFARYLSKRLPWRNFPPTFAEYSRLKSNYSCLQPILKANVKPSPDKQTSKYSVTIKGREDPRLCLSVVVGILTSEASAGREDPRNDKPLPRSDRKHAATQRSQQPFTSTPARQDIRSHRLHLQTQSQVRRRPDSSRIYRAG